MKAGVTEVLPVTGTSGGTKDLFVGKDEPLRICMQNCLESHQRCEHMIAHSSLKNGKHVEPAQLAILRDCSQACLMAADFMIRESQFHMLICRACSEICAACAEMCESFTEDDAMKQCAEACRRSAESCKMTGAMDAPDAH